MKTLWKLLLCPHGRHMWFRFKMLLPNLTLDKLKKCEACGFRTRVL